MQEDLERLLKEQQNLTQRINQALINSVNVSLENLKISNRNMASYPAFIESNITRIYVLLNDKTKVLSDAQRENLLRCRADLISLRTQSNLLSRKSEEFIANVEYNSRIANHTEQRTKAENVESKQKVENIMKVVKSDKAQVIEKNVKLTTRVESSLENIKKKINSPIRDTRAVYPKMEIRKKSGKSAIVKKMEANLGLYFMIAVGTLLCLFGISVFGKYVYLNVLGNLGKGILMYLISFIVLFTGQFLLRKVKNITIVKESVTGLGLGLLYLSALVNFLVLDNASYMLTHAILVSMSLYALYLSRNSNFDIIRIVGMVGVYIALIPITEPTLGSSFYILVLGYLFTVLNIVIPLKNTKYFEVLNIAAVVIFSILVNVYTSILIINILNSAIAIILSLYIYRKSDIKSPELYLFSFIANIIIFESIVSHSEVLSLLIAVVTLCYMPLLNAIEDTKKQINYKTIALLISTLLLYKTVETGALLVLLLNIIYLANIHYSSLVKNIYEHKFEFISLIFFNLLLNITGSLSILYLLVGLAPTIYTLSRCNYKKEFTYIIAFVLQIISFRIFINVFNAQSLYVNDMIILIYAMAMIVYNFILFKNEKIKKINIIVYLIFSMILFRTSIYLSVLLLLSIVILYKKKISNKFMVYSAIVSMLKLALFVYLSIGESYHMGMFIITIFISFIYIYKYHIERFSYDVIGASVGIFLVSCFVIESPILIVVLFVGIMGVFYKNSKSLLDMLLLATTTVFVMIYSYDNSYMIYILLFALFIMTSILKWSKIVFFNIGYYVLFYFIIHMAIEASNKWFIFAILVVNILVSHPRLKKFEKYFRTGNYSYIVFSAISIVIFGFILRDVPILSVLVIYYLISMVLSSEDESNIASIILIVALSVLVVNISVYITLIIVIAALNYKKMITQKDIDPILIVFLGICIVKTILYKNPVAFILVILFICASRYIYAVKDINVYKECKYLKITSITLTGIIAVILRMLIYIYLLENVIGIFIYAILSSFGIILLGFYMKAAWFRKVGLGGAMATCISILLFIKGMDTIQKTLICCGVGITCIIIAIVYSKLEKKYIK
ncbi:MAG: hypothetical protein ACRCWG_17650 [Sarcina sp.]